MSRLVRCVVCHRDKPEEEMGLLGKQGKRKCQGCAAVGGYRSWETFRARQAAKPHRSTRARGWESPEGNLFLLPDELLAYQESLRGERQKMPQGFWRDADGLSRGLACLRYLVEVVLGATTRAAVLQHATDETIKSYRLSAWRQVHPLLTYDCFAQAFPEHDILPWEMPEQVPRSYWERHGETALKAALTWWLEREGLTARDALRLSNSGKLPLMERLTEAGLYQAIKERTVREALRIVDPSIPAERGESKRARWRRLATMQCPWCGARFLSLAHHVQVVHSKTPEQAREALGVTALEAETLRKRRSMRQRGHPKRRWHGSRVLEADGPLWRMNGLSFPASWWPRRDYAYMPLIEEGALVLRATTRKGATVRQLRRMKGTRCEWRPPRLLLERLWASAVERVPEGIRILVPDPAVLQLVRQWASHKRRWTVLRADMRVNPSRSQMLIQTTLWPAAMRFAQVALRDDGAVVVKATNERSAHSYSVSPLSRHRDRMVINAASFLRYYRIVIGAWTLIERDDREGLLIFGYGGDEWQ